MMRATPVLAATTIAGLVASIWLYVDNRALRAARDERSSSDELAPQAKLVSTVASGMFDPSRARAGLPSAPQAPPSLPPQHEETRMERRARGTQEVAARFGRAPGETPEQYRERVMPMISAGLAVPRSRAEEMRKAAEEKAHVTAEQSKQLDHTFDKVYDDVIAYTDKAIADRQLSPYERNVAGWLEFAGGLGTILGDAQSQIGHVLSPDQMQSMSDAGFEWGEYLGLLAPWEHLQAPPPPR